MKNKIAILNTNECHSTLSRLHNWVLLTGLCLILHSVCLTPVCAQIKLYGLAYRGGTDAQGSIFHYDLTASEFKKDSSFKTLVDGESPSYTELVEGPNGKYFGSTNAGNYLFEWNPVSNEYTRVHKLTNALSGQGCNPLTHKDGKLYGMTEYGGTHGYGVIFEWDPAANTYTKKFDFNGANGRNPYSQLTLHNGKFYAMVPVNTTPASSLIFEWDPATNVFTEMINIPSISGGGGGLTQLLFHNGVFYGISISGGSSSAGVLFTWDPVSNIYIVKKNFNSSDGLYPVSLTLQDNKLYGLTRRGGTFGHGVIFEWDPVAEVYSKKINLPGLDGSWPLGKLMYINNAFYGITIDGGFNNYGVLFKWDPVSNIYTKKYTFLIPYGINPIGSMSIINSKLYGLTNGSGYYSRGAIFEYDPVTDSYSVKKSLMLTNGNSPEGSLTLHNKIFYGVTAIGGIYNAGVIFEFDPVTQNYTTKFNFNYGDGTYPIGKLSYKDGKFYGMTSQNGLHSGGTIYEWDPVTNIYTKKFDFNGTNGKRPRGSLTLKDGKFYGMTWLGGTQNSGVIFEWDPATNVFTKKLDLNSFTTGGNPEGSLILKDGLFYGMANNGGIYGRGTIFEWDPATNLISIKVHLYNAIGTYPHGSLVLKDDKFYGMTILGGASSKGVIFEWDPTTNIYTKKIDFNGSNGALPYGSLCLSGGKFYGLTYEGGSLNRGVIFEWDPVTNIYVKKWDMDAKGSNPFGDLVEYKSCEPMAFYLDSDSDGFGDASQAVFECEAPPGYVDNSLDCNDGNSDIHPNAMEICNGIDDDCDDITDEGFDPDGDDIPSCLDNCSAIYNPGQEDADCDQVGDACDVCPGGNDNLDRNHDGEPDCKVFPGLENLPESWKCGDQNEKVLVCHNENNPSTICIDESAVQAHLDHGDYLGPCDEAHCSGALKGKKHTSSATNYQDLDQVYNSNDKVGLTGSQIEQPRLEIWPNPVEDHMMIKLYGFENGDKVLKLVDLNGKLLLQKQLSSAQNTLELKAIRSQFMPGYYLLRVIGNNQRMTIPLILNP